VSRQLEIAATVLALLTGVIGGTVVIETRYAKSQEVRVQLNDFYMRTLKLRILELQLKPNATPSDKALLQYLQQEHRDTTAPSR
tara:strand:- start:177 stop:428 length:252 start_codon:yes stop_codon:yes gene_type:complete